MRVHETRFHMPLTRFGKEGAPCPFCGSTHLRVYVSSQPHVCCMACGADGPVVRHAANEAGPFIAIDLWNRRVSQASAEALKEEQNDETRTR